MRDIVNTENNRNIKMSENIIMDRVALIINRLPRNILVEDSEFIKKDLTHAIATLIDVKSENLKTNERSEKYDIVNNELAKIEVYVNMRNFQKWSSDQDFEDTNKSTTEYMMEVLGVKKPITNE